MNDEDKYDSSGRLLGPNEVNRNRELHPDEKGLARAKRLAWEGTKWIMPYGSLLDTVVDQNSAGDLYFTKPKPAQAVHPGLQLVGQKFGLEFNTRIERIPTLPEANDIENKTRIMNEVLGPSDESGIVPSKKGLIPRKTTGSLGPLFTPFPEKQTANVDRTMYTGSSNWKQQMEWAREDALEGFPVMTLTGKVNSKFNPYLTSYERKNYNVPELNVELPTAEELKRRGKLGPTWKSIDADNSLSISLSDSEKRDWSKYERDEKAYFLEKRWPRDKEFNELGDLIKSELQRLYPNIPLGDWKKHHTNPLAQAAKLLNGLKPAFRKKGVQIMLEEGLSAGHNPAQLNVIPPKIHTKIHRFINGYIGRQYSVKNLEQTYFNGADISSIPWEQRVPAVKQYANTIRESNEKIYDLMTALAVNKEHGPNVIPEVLAELNSKVDNSSDIGLDDLINQINEELGLQTFQGTVPKIDVLKLAEQWMDDPIKKKVLQAKLDGATRKELVKRFGKKLDIEQLNIFDQMTSQQYQMLQNRYKRGGKGSIIMNEIWPDD